MIAVRERGVPRSGVRVRDGLEEEVATVPSSPGNKTNGEDGYHGDRRQHGRSRVTSQEGRRRRYGFRKGGAKGSGIGGNKPRGLGPDWC